MKIITFFYLIISANAFIIANRNNISKYQYKRDGDNSTYVRHRNPFKPRPVVPCCNLKLPPPDNENEEKENDVKKIIDYIIKTFV